VALSEKMCRSKWNVRDNTVSSTQLASSAIERDVLNECNVMQCRINLLSENTLRLLYREMAMDKMKTPWIWTTRWITFRDRLFNRKYWRTLLMTAHFAKLSHAWFAELMSEPVQLHASLGSRLLLKKRLKRTKWQLHVLRNEWKLWESR